MFTSSEAGYPELIPDVNIYPDVIERCQIFDVLTIRRRSDVITSQKRQRHVKNGKGSHPL